MHAMGGFLSVGTQMKIERPGKACAVTPTSGIDGPLVLLENGDFIRINDEDQWNELSSQIHQIWDVRARYSLVLESSLKTTRI